MKRTAGVCVVLAILGGCSYIRPDQGCRECASADLRPVRPPAASSTTWSQREVASHADKPMLVPAGPVDPPPPARAMRPNLPAAGNPVASRPAASLASAAAPPSTLPLPTLETSSRTSPATLPPMPMPAAAQAPISRTGNLEKTSASELPKPMPPQVAAAVQSLTITPAEPSPGPSLDTSEPKPAKPNELKLGATDTVPGWTPTPYAPASPKNTSGPVVRLVNKKRITLNYEIKDVGPSGVSGVELWYTLDAKNWKKHDGSLEKKPPYIIEVQEEGLYGFTLLAKNGIGLSKDPPVSGDLPQVWVEVDLTRPTVAITEVKAGYENKVPALTAQWKASDKNLGGHPITLSYSEKEDGPWQPIAANVENSGRYVWPLRAGLPPRIYVRLEAKDLAGNVGVAKTPNPVQVDLSRPVVHVLDVEVSSP